LQKRVTITGGGNQKRQQSTSSGTKSNSSWLATKTAIINHWLLQSSFSNCKHEGINQLMVATATTASRQKGSNNQLVAKKVANFNRWQQKRQIISNWPQQLQQQ